MKLLLALALCALTASPARALMLERIYHNAAKCRRHVETIGAGR